MNANGSVLYSILDRLRSGTTTPDGDSSNPTLLSNYVMPALVDVLARCNLSSQTRIVMGFDVTLTQDVEAYPLPPGIQEVSQLVIRDEEDRIIGELVPNERSNIFGSIWHLEGPAEAMTLVIDGGLRVGTATVSVLYTPSGDFLPHYGTGTIATSSGVTTVSLTASPTLGSLDRRENAYVGGVLRLLPTSPSRIERSQITRSYLDSGVWKVELRHPFTNADGSYPYEIVPNGMQSFIDATTWGAALRLAPGRHLSRLVVEGLERNYRNAMKTLGDNLANAQTRRPRYLEKRTVDNGSILNRPTLYIIAE